MQDKKTIKTEKQKYGLTDFNKQAIHRCYMLMKDYLHSDGVEDIDCFYDMYAEIEKYGIAIPKGIYEEIRQCIDNFLAPIVYEPIKTFEQCYTDDIGFWDDNVWHIRDEEGTKKACRYYVMKLIEIEESVDNFASEKLYPLLTN